MSTHLPSRLTIRDLGYTPGLLPAGPTNSIVDVPGVHISQVTVETAADLKPGATATKGVTVISPRPPKEFYKPCHAGTFTFNGNGELTGSRQIADWGFTNTPIAFTNSLSLGTVFDGVWDWVIDQQEKMGWDGLTRARHYDSTYLIWGTPVVGETADWIVNSEVRSSRLGKEDIKRAFEGLRSREDGAIVQEGHAGGGAGMTCHVYAGGTGTASRLVGGGEGGAKEYTLGVLCQSNYGVLSELVVGGVPVGRLLQKEKDAEGAGKTADEDARSHIHAPAAQKELGGRTKDGSILVLIITDAPLASHQLQRLARHATAGLAQVGSSGVGRTFSGDIFLALSTAEHGPEQLEDFKSGRMRPTQTYTTEVVKNESIDAYFVACHEATEEAILNSLVGGREGTVTMDGTQVEGMPVDRVKELLGKYLVTI
ncbi:hypothetical protein LTR36_001441 [Oleoguttula mirabilis]|uniref:Aminopeptidase n=1 Tax=Oleoguttula mirabilis TaxID=1507867 RepID=A0AAV9JPD8_9PEZI|nr:hypothetical protein LTR36_001441 [Oleoguttula mirabilis]